MNYFFINLLIAVVCLTMLVVAVSNCVKSKNGYKVRWIAAIILLPALGPILYFQFARGKFVSDH